MRWILGQEIEPSEKIDKDEIEKVVAEILQEEIEQQIIISELKIEPRTIPEISKAADLPIEKVVRHVIDMRGAGIIAETGEKGDYFLYQSTKLKEQVGEQNGGL